MKKTLLALTLVGATASGAMAQGYITFQASGASHPIEYTTDGTTITKAAVGSPSQVPGYGNLNVAMYYAASGTTLALDANGLPNLSSWTLGTPTMSAITAIPGNISSTKVTLASATGGSPVQIEIVGWTGSASSFTAAEGNGLAGTLFGYSGSTLSGGALGWSNQTGTSTTPQGMNTGAAGYNVLVLAPVPEPATIALGGLGAAALLLFRRRK